MTNLTEKIKTLPGPIFIFGASGFIGANLLETLLQVRNDCYAITHNSRYAWRLKILNIPTENIIFCDINYKNSINQIFEAYQPKIIYNLAAYGAYSKQNNANLIFETNVLGTLNILEACKEIKAYIHAGSSSEYGINCENPDEDASMIPNSHYSVSKVSANYLIKYYGKFHQIPTMNLRLYSIYGQWEEPDRLIPRLIENAANGKLPSLVSPDISRDFVYIDDCVEAFVNAAYYIHPDIYGESVNIGSGIKTTMAELVNTVIKNFNLDITPVWGSMENRNWDVENWYGNYTKAQQLIKWRPTTSVEEGLKKYEQWQDSINYKNVVLPAFLSPERINKITCVIACYKDEQAIPYMYEGLLKAFEKCSTSYEIIFVNDASPDNTQEVLEKICEKDSNVVAITHSRNFGSQAAFVSGMEISTGDVVVPMDGDLQDPPSVIPLFYEKWLEGYDVVYGHRVRRETSFVMNIMYKLFYKIFSKLSYIKIPRDAGDFSMIDRKVVRQLVSLPEKEQFLRGLRAWVGFNQTGVDYFRPERMFGRSTNNWRKNFWWAKKALFSFSFVPLEILSYIGLSITLISFCAMVFQIIAKLLFPNIPHGITTVIVLILFFGGLNILGISFLGEYIAKIFEETKGRPKFIRKTIIHRSKKLDTADKIDNLIKSLKF